MMIQNNNMLAQAGELEILKIKAYRCAAATLDKIEATAYLISADRVLITKIDLQGQTHFKSIKLSFKETPTAKAIVIEVKDQPIQIVDPVTKKIALIIQLLNDIPLGRIGDGPTLGFKDFSHFLLKNGENKN